MGRGWKHGVVEHTRDQRGRFLSTRCRTLGNHKYHDSRNKKRAYLSCTELHGRENASCVLKTQLKKTKRRLLPSTSAQTQEISPVVLLHCFDFGVRISFLTEHRFDFLEIRSVLLEERVPQAPQESMTRSMAFEDDLAPSLHCIEGVELNQKPELL